MSAERDRIIDFLNASYQDGVTNLDFIRSSWKGFETPESAIIERIDLDYDGGFLLMIAAKPRSRFLTIHTHEADFPIVEFAKEMRIPRLAALGEIFEEIAKHELTDHEEEWEIDELLLGT
jgi:hypothetical protein